MCIIMLYIIHLSIAQMLQLMFYSLLYYYIFNHLSISNASNNAPALPIGHYYVFQCLGLILIPQLPNVWNFLCRPLFCIQHSVFKFIYTAAYNSNKLYCFLLVIEIWIVFSLGLFNKHFHKLCFVLEKYIRIWN